MLLAQSSRLKLLHLRCEGRCRLADGGERLCYGFKYELNTASSVGAHRCVRPNYSCFEIFGVVIGYSLFLSVYLRDYFSGCYRANTSVRPYGFVVLFIMFFLCAHFVRSVLLSYFILGEHIGSPLRSRGITLLCLFVRNCVCAQFLCLINV